MAKIYFIAGEASGDALGASIIAALRNSRPDITVAGIGGQAMDAVGLKSLFPQRDLAVMGLTEVLPKIPLLWRRIHQTVADIQQQAPSLLVTIDSPDFCLRVAKRLDRQKIKIIHLVAPSVWAWRAGRAQKISRLIDHLLCLLPFEPGYFTPHGLSASFIGHPVLDSPILHGDAARLLNKYQLSDDDDYIALLPGSRVGEVRRLLPVFLPTLRELERRLGRKLNILLPSLPHLVPIIE